MSKEDNDLINNAIESAQEKLGVSDDKDIEAPKAESEATSEAPDTVEVEESTTETPLEESETETDTDQVANVESSTSEEQPQAAQTEQIEPPAFWTAERKALFSKAPPELKKAIAEEALRQQQHMSRLANESQRGKQWESRVNSDFQSKEEFEAHRAQLRLQGVQDEVAELHRYRDWNRLMKSDPITAVRGLIDQFQITPDELNSGALSDEQERYANDPRVDAVIEELRQEREAREQAERQREHQSLASQINTWKSGSDKFGKPRAEFSALYAPQIDSEWQQILNEAAQSGIQLSLEESLNHAYERVQGRIFKAHGINPSAPKQPTPEQRAAQVAKVQSAVTRASGAPRSDVITKKPRKQYKNDKERVEAAMKRAEEKISAHR